MYYWWPLLVVLAASRLSRSEQPSAHHHDVMLKDMRPRDHRLWSHQPKSSSLSSYIKPFVTQPRKSLIYCWLLGHLVRWKRATKRSHLGSGTKMILWAPITEERQEKVMVDWYNKLICYTQVWKHHYKSIIYTSNVYLLVKVNVLTEGLPTSYEH